MKKTFAILFLAWILAHARSHSEENMSGKQDVQKGIYSLTKTLMHALSSEFSGENVVFSSFNIYVALALAQLGANGDTLKELSHFLKIPVVNYEEIPDDSHQRLKQLVEDLQQSVDVNVSIANGVFINKDYNAKDSYKDKTKRYYKSEIVTLDFSSGPEAPTKTVNQWVSDKTKGRIPKVYSSEPLKNIPLLLASAIHFEANWRYKFAEELTHKMPFSGTRGVMDVDMMEKTHRVLYKRDEVLKYQTIALPYSNPAFSYYVILPDEGVSVDSLLASLKDDAAVDDIFSNSLQYRQVHFAIPKHKVGVTLSLPDTLKKVGVTNAFTNKADFTNMGDGLNIGDIIHKCEVEVMETGTVASAATVVEMSYMSAPFMEERPIDFIVNRPFIFYIYNSNYNTFLFSGVIHKPTY